MAEATRRKKHHQKAQGHHQKAKTMADELKKVETTLKLVQIPNDMLLMSFKRMWPAGSNH